MEDIMEIIESDFQTRRNKKKETYSKAAEARWAAFAPIITTCNDVLGREAKIYIKQLGVHIFKGISVL